MTHGVTGQLSCPPADAPVARHGSVRIARRRRLELPMDGGNGPVASEVGGAGRGNRTPTVLPPADFESATSTSSVIPAARGAGPWGPVAPMHARALRIGAGAPLSPKTPARARSTVRCGRSGRSGKRARRDHRRRLRRDRLAGRPSAATDASQGLACARTLAAQVSRGRRGRSSPPRAHARRTPGCAVRVRHRGSAIARRAAVPGGAAPGGRRRARIRRMRNRSLPARDASRARPRATRLGRVPESAHRRRNRDRSP